MAGDFNQANTKTVFLYFDQYVDFATRGKSTLDLAYSNIKKAFRATTHPHLGFSDHLSVAVFRQSTKLRICPSCWWLGLRTEGGKLGVCFGQWIFCLGEYTYFRLACYLKTRRKCAGLCVRWAEVSMTCTVVQPTAGEF